MYKNTNNVTNVKESNYSIPKNLGKSNEENDELKRLSVQNKNKFTQKNLKK